MREIDLGRESPRDREDATEKGAKAAAAAGDDGGSGCGGGLR